MQERLPASTLLQLQRAGGKYCNYVRTLCKYNKHK